MSTSSPPPRLGRRAPPPRRSQRTTEQVEEELSELKRRYSLLEGDRKAYYETSQWTIRANKETVESLRRENRAIRQSIQEVNKQSRVASNSQDGEKEIAKLERQTLRLRKQYDQSRADVRKCDKEVADLHDKLSSMETESAGVSQEKAKKIRTLENQLDRATIRINEATSIQKAYKEIRQRLEEERLTFDSQLANSEKFVTQKKKEYLQVVSMSGDAVEAKDVAQAELVEFEHQVAMERRARERDLAERRQAVQAKAEMNDRLEKRLKGRGETSAEVAAETETDQRQPAFEPSQEDDHDHRVTTYEEAFRKIKEATGVSDPAEVIEKFMTQEDTHANLDALKLEAQKRVEQLTTEKNAHKVTIEELKYSGAASMGNRRMVDDLQARATSQSAVLERNKQRYERVAKVVMSVKAGVEHLADTLEPIRLDFPTIPLKDDTIVDVLFQCEQKLAKVLETLAVEADGPEADDALGQSTNDPNLPSSNIRIALPEESDSSDEAPSSDDDLPDRNAVKMAAEQALDKSQKKSRKPRAGPSRNKKSTTRRF